MNRRVISLWFPRLASERILRARPVEGPFALIIQQNNTKRLYCLNSEAEQAGLSRGMGFADAHALCPNLTTLPADTMADMRFQHVLARWAGRYCPWVGLEGWDGLVLDITGSAHLFGGEEAMISDMRMRLMRAGLTACIGLGDSRGGAWALAHFHQGSAAPGQMFDALKTLPVAALRLDDTTCTTLHRLGVRTIEDVAALPRANITRRFGPSVLLRLDQALGQQAEQVSPLKSPPHYGVRLTLPEPIGLVDDVMAGLERLLGTLCIKLKEHEKGVRILRLALRRVDQTNQQIELRLARPMRDPVRILALFERSVNEVDAGFGIDQLRLEGVQIEPLPVQQLSHAHDRNTDALSDLITRLGSRIGLENITRFLPADSHIPEREFSTALAAYSAPAPSWPGVKPRPLRLFPPEPIAGSGRKPPETFRWRNMALSTARATGPERLTPEWWFDDANWRSGLRDYWRIDTNEGRRLWLFHTPQNPNWFVHGEFA
ncbi:MAG: Y-family DNA polymerase [Hyphomicrobiales bacterium]